MAHTILEGFRSKKTKNTLLKTLNSEIVYPLFKTEDSKSEQISLFRPIYLGSASTGVCT